MEAVILNIKDSIKSDRFLWSLVFILTFCSLLAVYSTSASLTKFHSDTTIFFLLKHVPFVIVGLFITWIFSKIDYLEFNKWAPVMLIISVVLQIWALFFGVDINEAKRWIQVPFLDISFQPSDFAKIALICFVARSLSAKQDQIKSFKNAFVPLLLPIVVVCGLIAPANFSTAALLFLCCLMMLFVGRVSLVSIFGLILLGAAAFGFLIFLSEYFPHAIRSETWANRLNEFLNSEDGGHQIQQAKIAIANGGWFGESPGNSTLRNFVPYAWADFIYAIICEEWGVLIGGGGIILIYLMLLIHCVSIVTKSPKAFGALLAIGLGFNIVIHAFANIAVSLDLVPVTGVNLPMISKGGTSLLLTCAAFGMIISVSKNLKDLNLSSDSLDISTNHEESTD